MLFRSRTIKNHFRAEKFTNLPVISALPDTKRFKYKEYIEADLNIALKTLSNELFPLIKSGQVTKINVFGVVNTDDSPFFIDSISKLWTEKDVNFKVISHKSDFDNTTTEYRRADSISEIVEIPNDIEVLVVEYAPLSEVNIPTALLNNAALNLIVINSERVWKNSDSRILDKIIDRNDTDHKFKIILHKVDRPIIEDFVGMLPPYTFVRRWAYRISHLG